LWYEPGFRIGRPEFERWHPLLRRIRQGKCTPVIGTGVLEAILGSPREIAWR
jgi:hypothetical protein